MIDAFPAPSNSITANQVSNVYSIAREGNKVFSDHIVAKGDSITTTNSSIK